MTPGTSPVGREWPTVGLPEPLASSVGTLTTPDEITYTYDETARKLGISERTLRRLVTDGRIPHHRFGRLVRFTDGDITEILAMSRVAPLPRSSRR